MGLDCRLLGDVIGMPSRISSPLNDGDRPIVLGNGRFDSRPARVDNTSKLERRLAVLNGEVALVLPLEVEYAVGDDGSMS